MGREVHLFPASVVSHLLLIPIWIPSEDSLEAEAVAEEIETAMGNAIAMGQSFYGLTDAEVEEAFRILPTVILPLSE